jgi:hypothetical protein
MVGLTVLMIGTVTIAVAWRVLAPRREPLADLRPSIGHSR